MAVYPTSHTTAIQSGTASVSSVRFVAPVIRLAARNTGNLQRDRRTEREGGGGGGREGERESGSTRKNEGVKAKTSGRARSCVCACVRVYMGGWTG